MAISRRTGLAALAAASALLPRAAFAPALAFPPGAAPACRPAFVTARRDRDGHAAAVLDGSGRTILTERLAARGHGAAVSPDGRRAVVFARRPGRFALVLDLDPTRRTRAARFAPPPGRHFYGHGFFSPDGRLVYATENDYEAERGVLGVYDLDAGHRRVGELDTHGIGPHEAVLMRDGRTIAVANGGVATHPEYPRRKLNLGSMQPSLAYLERTTGALLDRVAPPPRLRRLSIRHLVEAEAGTVWFGGQYEGPKTDRVELVGRHRRGQDRLDVLPAPPSVYEAMRGYVGSIAASRDGTRVAATSPRGGRLTVWDTRSGEVLETRRIADVCGVAPGERGFVASDGRGRVWIGGEAARGGGGQVEWDNHLAAVPSAGGPAEAAA